EGLTMSMNYTGAPPIGGATDENDSPMFAPIPAWERGAKKRRGLGGGAKAAAPAAATTAPMVETRTFEAPLAEREVRTTYGETPRVAAAEPMIAQPRATTTKRSSNAAPLAIAAGVVMIGGLA